MNSEKIQMQENLLFFVACNYSEVFFAANLENHHCHGPSYPNSVLSLIRSKKEPVNFSLLPTVCLLVT